MATNNEGEALYSSVVFYHGTAGSMANTPWGYIRRDNTVDIAVSDSIEELRVHGKELPLRLLTGDQACKVTVPLLQVGNLPLLGTVLGAAPSDAVVEVGSPTADRRIPQISMALVATTLAGTTFRFDMPYCSSRRGFSLQVGPRVVSTPTIEFEALDGGAVPYFTVGSGINVTLASDVLAFTGRYHRVVGEGGVADVMDDHSGLGAGDDGEVFMLQPGSALYAITVTHNAGQLELTGGVGETFAMGGTAAAYDDFILLQYIHGSTLLNEIGRYDAP